VNNTIVLSYVRTVFAVKMTVSEQWPHSYVYYTSQQLCDR